MRKDGDCSRGPLSKDETARLARHEKEMEPLRKGTCSSREFLLWRKRTEETLKDLFGPDSPEAREFNAIYYTPVFLTCRMGDEAFDEAYRDGLEEARRFLRKCMK